MTTNIPNLPKDKADLLEHIQREWTALMAIVERLSGEQMARRDSGGWSIKDNLAHITAWEEFLIRNQFEGQAAHTALGIDRATLEKLDEAGMNASLLERHHARPLPEVMADLRQTHNRLLEALEKLTEGDLWKMSQTIGPQAGPMIQWVVFNTYEHYQEHRQTIQANVAW